MADNTFGPAYNERLDGERVHKQMDVIRDLMIDGKERTLQDIEALTGYPQSSISAQLRHLRKQRFGGYQVFKRRVGETGLYVYWLLKPAVTQTKLFDHLKCAYIVIMNNAPDYCKHPHGKCDCGWPDECPDKCPEVKTK